MIDTNSLRALFSIRNIDDIQIVSGIHCIVLYKSDPVRMMYKISTIDRMYVQFEYDSRIAKLLYDYKYDYGKIHKSSIKGDASDEHDLLTQYGTMLGVDESYTEVGKEQYLEDKKRADEQHKMVADFRKAFDIRYDDEL